MHVYAHRRESDPGPLAVQCVAWSEAIVTGVFLRDIHCVLELFGTEEEVQL